MKSCPNNHGRKPGKFCSECGAELQEAEEKKTDLPFEIKGHEPCPACGYELDHGHQKFCPGCGHAIKYTCRGVSQKRGTMRAACDLE